MFTRSCNACAQQLWDVVLACLHEDLKLDGVRGPSVVARDIASAACPCRAVAAAVPAALNVLAARLLALDEWHDGSLWPQLIKQPHAKIRFANCQIHARVQVA